MPKNSSNPRSAPPVYRSQPARTIQQQKVAVTSQETPAAATKTSLNWSAKRITGVAGMRPAQAHGQTSRTHSTKQVWSPALFPNPPGTIQAAKKKKKKAAAPPARPRWQKAWDNLRCYSRDKADNVETHYGNGYPQIMQAFVDYYRDGIRGHCSEGGGSHQNAQTTQDLAVFTGWYRRLRDAARDATRRERRSGR